MSHLSELKQAVHDAKACLGTNGSLKFRKGQNAFINPGLIILDVPWEGLLSYYKEQQDGADSPAPPVAGRELLLVWPNRDDEVRITPAEDSDLLALKLVGDGLALSEVAEETGAPAAGLARLLVRAHRKGLITLPPSKLARSCETHPRPEIDGPKFPEDVFASRSFVLQWHITQRCDLDCKHCYDRSPRSDVSLENGFMVLEQMARFCSDRLVVGQVSFSGGNPILHSNFFDFYAKAVALGLTPAILGNPCSATVLDRLCSIESPVYYQISLEGLEEHNNTIRGEGHFQRTMDFLEMLQERDIYSQVMLTLTAANQEQVIPLGEFLTSKVDSFTYNRLAPVGQGASLACAPTHDYSDFLRRYLEAAKRLPHMGLKDSLFNIPLHDTGSYCFGGCTGSGCGAAYNFLSVLGDGTAHACRKMDSVVGNIHESGLDAVYDDEVASQYRTGTMACRDCLFRAGCGGCMAVVKGLGLDPFVDRDPYCPLA